MAERETLQRLSRRLTRAGVDIPEDHLSHLAAYVELLAKWNRKISLTSLPVDPLSDDAADRLIVEPVIAARSIASTDRVVMDVGSGGGSPAVPFFIAAGAADVGTPRPLQMVMVEVKVRKSAFLREVVRQLSLPRVTVETCRVEELLARPELHEAADLVTIRAVRPDRRLLVAIQAFLRPGGRLFLFGAESSTKPEMLPVFTSGHIETLVASAGSQLLVMNKNAKLF